MKLKSTIISLVIGLSLVSMACGGGVSMSKDDQHKLFQAASLTGDTNVAMGVAKKLELTDADGKPTAAFSKFTQEHFEWVKTNSAFIMEYADKKKAKEYVDTHSPK